MHLGGLLNTQEARVALLRFFRALQTSSVLHNSIVHALKHEPVGFTFTFKYIRTTATPMQLFAPTGLCQPHLSSGECVFRSGFLIV